MAEESPQKQSPPDKNEEMLPVLEQTCADYSQYLDVNTDKERKMIEDSIEDMLTHLDEFCGVVDMVRSESNLALNKTLPELYERSLEIRKTYERIDQLEKKPVVPKPEQRKKFVPPEIFKTDDFFPPKEDPKTSAEER
ncbi:BLOC1S4 [Branchiostoma lanceolatum]|uniref:BLOC1S4 protein n=1 Tax=Branchiostoma lanceolatum TaxID=7740 RepID=A0A8K0AAB6_BRALA|nr:BLOC1S4 [Branchiostoma lanceolatum]